jgi:excisionase family DNA binding protein
MTALIPPSVLEQWEQSLGEFIRGVVREELEALQPAAPRRWLTLAEAAARLGVSSDAVRMRVRRGRLEFQKQGRRLYVSAESVDRIA